MEVFHPEAAHHIEPAKPQNAFVKMWKKVGGGSLTFSIMVHAGILLAMFLIVVAKSVVEKQVDFLPGGGTAQGAAASADLQHKVQQKKRSSINKTVQVDLPILGDCATVLEQLIAAWGQRKAADLGDAWII